MSEGFPSFQRAKALPQDDTKESEEKIFIEQFGPKQYLADYYDPNIDVDRLAHASRELHASGPLAHVDVRNLKETLGVSHETVENLLIFDFQKTVAKRLLEAYPQDHIDVLDVGGGPTICQHIAMSLSAGHITHSEFLEQNRAEVGRWVDNNSEAHNWDRYFALFQKMLREDPAYQSVLNEHAGSSDEAIRAHAAHVKETIGSDSIAPLTERVRQRIAGNIVHGDVFRADLGLPSNAPFEAVDATTRENAVEMITSNFTVESATGDRALWESGMHNIMSKIKPGGFLALTAIRNAEWYKVGEEKMPAVKVDENDIRSFCEANGFTVEELRVLEGSDKETVGYDGMVFILARKS